MTDAVPGWLAHPIPGQPPSPACRRVLDAYCAELDIDPDLAQLPFMTHMEAVRWWNSGAPELYKGPTAAAGALAKFDAFTGGHDSEDDDEYRAMLVRQDREERLARVMPDPARARLRTPRSKHAPVIQERDDG